MTVVQAPVPKDEKEKEIDRVTAYRNKCTAMSDKELSDEMDRLSAYQEDPSDTNKDAYVVKIEGNLTKAVKDLLDFIDGGLDLPYQYASPILDFVSRQKRGLLFWNDMKFITNILTAVKVNSRQDAVNITNILTSIEPAYAVIIESEGMLSHASEIHTLREASADTGLEIKKPEENKKDSKEPVAK